MASGARRSGEATIEVEVYATALAAAAAEKKGSDLAILDMRKLVSYTDALVLVTGRNPRHVKAISDAVVRRARELGHEPSSVEGLESCKWVLVDLSDVVVHVFDQAMRGYYDLDGLWSDAPRLPIPVVTIPEGADDDDDSEPLFSLP